MQGASTFNPTVIVNTESFEQVDDGDSTTDVELRFGADATQRVLYDKTNSRFKVTRALYITGNLTITGAMIVNIGNSGTAAPDTGLAIEIIGTASGRVLHAQDALRSSGSLIIDGSLIVLGHSSFTTCTALETVAGVLTCGTDDSGTGGGAFTSTGSLQFYFDKRYVAVAGDTMTGGLLIVRGGAGTQAVDAAALLEIAGTMSGRTIMATDTLNASGTLIVKKRAGTATGNVLIVDTAGLVYDATNKAVGIGTAVLEAGLRLEVAGVASGRTLHAQNQLQSSGSLTVVGNVKIDGTTFFADTALNMVGIGTLTPETRLEVAGTMSGNALYVTRSLSGAGLSNCDNGTNDKLLWSVATGRFSCGSDQGGAGGLSITSADLRYVKKSGDVMTGGLLIQSGNPPGVLEAGLLLDVAGTLSGRLIHAQNRLESSGSLVVNQGATVSGSLVLRTRNDPSAPSTGSLAIYAKNIAGRILLKGKGPSGVDYPYQPAFFQNNVMLFYPSNSTTVGTVDGWTFTSAGTVSHPTIASTNLQTSMRRTQWASATTANAVGGIFTAQTNIWRGNAARLGGFFFFARFSQLTSTNGARAFVGLSAATAHVVAAEPSAAVDTIGVGYDAADVPGNWRLMTNDASGVATETDLGASAVRNTTDVYDLFIFAKPFDNKITVRMINQTSGVVVADNIVVTTNLPTATTFLRVHAGGGPAASAVAQNFQLNRLYVESDF